MKEMYKNGTLKKNFYYDDYKPLLSITLQQLNNSQLSEEHLVTHHYSTVLVRFQA